MSGYDLFALGLIKVQSADFTDSYRVNYVFETCATEFSITYFKHDGWAEISHGPMRWHFAHCTAEKRPQLDTAFAARFIREVYPDWWILNDDGDDCPVPFTDAIAAAIVKYMIARN
jgi:hypothetical protein